MTKMTELLLAKSGKTVEDLSRNSTVGKLIRSGGVRSGPEFQRIMALPRRKWETDAGLQELITLLTNHCKTPTGTRVLRPGQAVALRELHDFNSCLCASELGSGKTDVGFLAAVIKDARRPLFLAPAKLLGDYNKAYECTRLGKTEREFKKLGLDWEGNPNWKFLSYEKLSRDKQSDFLDRYEPDLIVAEEAHRLKNVRSGRTKRVKRYMNAHPDTFFIPLTGSLKRRSLLECAHIAEWAMREYSPIPRTKFYGELDEWRRALDIGTREQDSVDVGVLSAFAPGGDLQAIRDAYTTYRQETPGWVTVTGSGIDCSLLLEGEKVEGFPSHVDDKFEALRASYETPDGESFVEPAQLWQYLRQCSLGFWYRLNPPPPKEWKDARRAWGQFVREILSHNRQHLDTEMQVARACSKGEVIDHGLYARWKEIKPSYNPDDHRTTEWFDDTFINWCVKWLEKEKSPLFTPYIAFGKKMKEITGLPYFHESGRDPKFGSIDEYKKGPCIASMTSVMEGFNLQQWNKGALVGGSSNSSELHQLIGRFHRPGQEADEVEFTFAYSCIETLDALWRARAEAEAGDNRAHKLVMCDFAVDPLEEAETWPGARWAK